MDYFHEFYFIFYHEKKSVQNSSRMFQIRSVSVLETEKEKRIYNI